MFRIPNISARLFIILYGLFFSFTLEAQTNHWETIIYDSSVWHYTIPEVTTSPSWILPSYDASGWTLANGGFGNGDNDDQTILPMGTTSVYQRIPFNIVDTSLITKLIFNIDYDDGYVAYLNGIEIARNGMILSGQPLYNQFASISHEAVLYQGQYPDQLVFTSEQLNTLIHNGENILCVEVHNQNSSSSDLTSRAFLSVGISNSQIQYGGTTPSWFIPPFEFQQSNLPIVVLNTNGISIADEPKINAVMGIVYNGPGNINAITDPFNEFYGQIAIETRGSSSQSFPMKSYSLETRGPDPSINYNVSLFDWPADNDWILYAPYNDKTLIRNVLTYNLGNKMGRYSPRTQLCEVVLNGDYQGVYVLMERIKQNPGRVSVDELNYADTTDNELSGGYIFKIDKTTGNSTIAWNSPFLSEAPSNTTISFQMHDPDLSSMHPLQREYIQNYVTNWETVLNSPNFADPQLGYQHFIDVGSFIDFMLVNELSKNVDGYRISTFLHKQRVSEGGKIIAGPLWDFNIAWGNSDYCQGSVTSGWEIDFNSICGGGYDNPFWWKKLLEDPVFADNVNCRWLELRNSVFKSETIFSYIDSLAQILTEPATRNYQKWPILGTYVWPNNFVGNTYAEEVNYMKNWIENRLLWMDNNMFGTTCQNLNVTDEIEQNNNISIFPNPATDFVTIQSRTQCSHTKISLKNSLGQEIFSEEVENFSEQKINVNTFSKGLYLLEIVTDGGIVNIKKLQIK
jgi:spore coat protein CotH